MQKEKQNSIDPELSGLIMVCTVCPKTKVYFGIFAEFGVYVDSKGRRSRPADLKWSCLPLSFGKLNLMGTTL